MPKQKETMSRAVSPKPSVAIIGTGTMGSAVARRLLGAGVVTNVWNRDEKSWSVRQSYFGKHRNARWSLLADA